MHSPQMTHNKWTMQIAVSAQNKWTMQIATHVSNFHDKTGGGTVKWHELMELPRIQAKCVLCSNEALMCKAYSSAPQCAL